MSKVTLDENGEVVKVTPNPNPSTIISDGGELCCECHNDSGSDGFYPCLPDGTAPLIGSDWDGYYYCGKCLTVAHDCPMFKCASDKDCGHKIVPGSLVV